MSRISRQDEEVRPARVPVSSSRSPLAVKGFDHKNFSGRWVADIDDRIGDFLQGGYEFVPKKAITQSSEATVDTGKGLDNRVSKSGGRGITLYLMRLPRKLYNEDQKAKQREIDLLEQAMKTPGKGSVSDEVDYGSISLGSQPGDEKIGHGNIIK